MAQGRAISVPRDSRGEIAALVEELSAELDDVAAALADTIHEHLDELDDDMRVWTLQSTRANLGVMVTLMREGADPRSVMAPPEAIGYAKEYVVRGLDFVLLQRAYRTAQGVFAGMILERLRQATDDADHLADAMGFFNAWIFAWIEAIERQLTDVYMAEREQWVRGAAAMRAAEVRAILGGAEVDVTEVSGRLGYDLDRHHVGFVVWKETAEDSPGAAGALFGEMEQVAAAVAESLGSRSALTVAQGRHLACWAGRHELQHLGDLRVPRGAGKGLSVAAGTPAHGVDGFVLSHSEALLARRVAQLRGDSAARVTFPDVSLEALMIDDPEAARRFAKRELGPLTAEDDATRRLASTLAIFLDEGASFTRAARRLGVHTNTVTYRVHRAEELLGHSASERQIELRVALRLAGLARPEAFNTSQARHSKANFDVRG
ncbi:MAG TPA: helix-turn-helix domain-containing protein [Solirubrobacterales bacterium]|nr:helix-turn-helix domain-containing protein [Solirubrobacterales bacterium]